MLALYRCRDSCCFLAWFHWIARVRHSTPYLSLIIIIPFGMPCTSATWANKRIFTHATVHNPHINVFACDMCKTRAQNTSEITVCSNIFLYYSVFCSPCRWLYVFVILGMFEIVGLETMSRGWQCSRVKVIRKNIRPPTGHRRLTQCVRQGRGMA